MNTPLISIYLSLAYALGNAQTTIVFASAGDPAPGGGFFSGGQTRSLNKTGEMAFGTSLGNANGEINGDSGIFRGDGKSIVEIVRSGQAVPDGNGTFLAFSGQNQIPILNDTGQIVFPAKLANTTGGLADDHAFFLGNGNTLIRIAREGQAAPDGNGTLGPLDRLLHRPTLNNRGQVGFLGSLTGTAGGAADNAGIFLSDGTTLTQIARAGQQVLGGNLGQLFHRPVLNDQGTIAFRGTISGGENDGTHILRSGGDSLVSIGGPGRAIPGGNGVTISSVFNHSEINELGQLSIEASLTGTPGGAVDNYGLFRGDGETLVQIARKGQAAPSGNGTLTFPSSGHINNSGQVVFSSALTDTTGGANDDFGLFLGDGDSLIEIVREGQAVPDGGGFFDQRGLFIAYFPSINAVGQVAFSARINDADGNHTGHGIFFFDPATGLHTVARNGTPLLGSTISGATIDHPNPFDPPFDLPMGFNDRGQIAYNFTLEDGRRGIARWEMAQVARPLRVTDVFRDGDILNVSFEATPGLKNWQIFGSTDLMAFPDNLTADSAVTELTPGDYRSVIPVEGKPSTYFVQIRQ